MCVCACVYVCERERQKTEQQCTATAAGGGEQEGMKEGRKKEAPPSALWMLRSNRARAADIMQWLLTQGEVLAFCFCFCSWARQVL